MSSDKILKIENVNRINGLVTFDVTVRRTYFLGLSCKTEVVSCIRDTSCSISDWIYLDNGSGEDHFKMDGFAHIAGQAIRRFAKRYNIPEIFNAMK